jgi:hypothetical protein
MIDFILSQPVLLLFPQLGTAAGKERAVVMHRVGKNKASRIRLLGLQLRRRFVEIRVSMHPCLPSFGTLRDTIFHAESRDLSWKLLIERDLTHSVLAVGARHRLFANLLC